MAIADIPAPDGRAKEMKFPRHLLGGLDEAVATELVAASGDVAMVIDKDGVIRDLAISNEMLRDGVGEWLDKPWSDNVMGGSRQKVEELLRDAQNGAAPRWREVNHFSSQGDSVTLKYLTLSTGREGRVIAIGREDRATAMLQQRLLQAQQSMEREYARLRDAEARYRLLFQISSEAVLIVDGASRKVVEANPAADALVGGAGGSLIGRPFSRLFEAASHEPALSLLTVVQSTSRTNGAQARLISGAGELTVSASLFRQDRAEFFLVRLAPVKAQQEAVQDGASRLLDVLEDLPEAFVVTDESLNILAENAAFLDLVRLASKEQARGQSLAQFLGRSAVDRNILIANLREHGSVRNFGTVLTNQLQDREEVEVTAVYAPDAHQPCFGFTIRRSVRRTAAASQGLPELGRSVEQLTELVGRVSLKDLVRETTDLVERLCIEAALELTGNNRASAAQVLGLSRQSLYSKLGRFELGSQAPAE